MSETITKKDLAWIERFKRTMAAAPPNIGKKIWSFTVGDDEIILYDKNKFDKYFEDNPISLRDIRDHDQLVEASEAEITIVEFPFPVESTAG